MMLTTVVRQLKIKLVDDGHLYRMILIERTNLNANIESKFIFSSVKFSV